jgi:hypothetical protein
MCRPECHPGQTYPLINDILQLIARTESADQEEAANFRALAPDFRVVTPVPREAQRRGGTDFVEEKAGIKIAYLMGIAVL